MQYAAHIRKDQEGNIQAIQTVEEHCRNTAQLASVYASEFGCGQLGYLVGMFHDMGKMNQDFNNYIHDENDMQRGEIDHCYPGAKYLFEIIKEYSFKDFEKPTTVRQTVLLAGRVILTHHGLRDWLLKDSQDTFTVRIGKDERYEEIVSNFECIVPKNQTLKMLSDASEEYSAIRQLIVDLVGESSRDGAVKQEFYRGLFERLLLSVLVDADRTDTAEFASDIVVEKTFDLAAVWQEAESRMDILCDKFAEKTDHISECRRSISDRCVKFANHPVGICKLVVPTGGGKTLSSLRFALRYCRKQNINAKHIYYVAPFMSILEQNSDVIKSIVGEENVLEHYSDMIAQLSDEKDNDNARLKDYELKIQKYSDPVITTTMVQFLNTLFSGNMASVRRVHSLCNSVIIIDEIQSLPVKCISMFNLAMNFLSRVCGTTIILCSATQPALTSVQYPILMDERESMTGDYTEDFKQFKRNEIVPVYIKNGLTNKEAADFCVEKFRQIGSTLFIVNTKATAASIYSFLLEKELEGIAVMYLSTNMCPEHRRNKLKTLRKLLDEKKPVICVTTQLIEAGVDISFPCVIRSLAGLDNAAQAAGRCNRNGEAHDIMKVYLVYLTEENIGPLKDIQKAQTASRDMLLVGENKDWLSAETMEKFSKNYFQEQKEEHDYPVSDDGVKETILNLLSVDTKRRKPGGKVTLNKQAFKTAGFLFKPIDQNTKQIIVPYDKRAEQEIADLNSMMPLNEIVKHLRTSGKYSVSMYEQAYRRLNEQGAIYNLCSGALALKKEFYDENLGVISEGKPMDLLLF